MENDRPDNLIVNKTIELSLQIIDFCDVLTAQNKKVVSNQLLRSVTSVGANVWEAQSAESRADFIHKMKIAAKEADESEYWLILCNKAKSYPTCPEILLEIKTIQKILSKIISSSKNN